MAVRRNRTACGALVALVLVAGCGPRAASGEPVPPFQTPATAWPVDDGVEIAEPSAVPPDVSTESWVRQAVESGPEAVTTTPPAPDLVADVDERAVRTATPSEFGLGWSFVPEPTGRPLPALPTPECANGTSAADLTALFDRRAPLLGADYQRAYPLPSGRVLWLFQDGYVATPHGPGFVHNVGLLQSGRCFQLLRGGTADEPRSYLLSEHTIRFHTWFWPLGGDMGTDGRLHVFVAEMHEYGSEYLVRTEPVATWLVTIEPTTLDVVDARLAPDSSAALYGWSVVSDEEHTYLYAQCHRQFGFDPLWFAPDVLAHDEACSGVVTVARLPLGVFSAAPEYWDGAGWGGDPARAVPVIPRDGRPVNPTQVARGYGGFVAVTKVGDWWSHQIVLDVAPEATGPWTTYGSVDVWPKCAECNTYFASIVPYGADATSFLVGVSCNTWSGACNEHYAPTFLRVPAPS